jgi:transcriptional repressor NrdR
VTDANAAIRRRRECEDCKYRFTTFERAKTTEILVIKKDQTREPYDHEKLEKGIWKACGKRPISHSQISDLLSRLEEKWSTQKEVDSTKIGEDVMNELKQIDQIAYIRFASVYRQFADVENFMGLISKMVNETKVGEK